MKVSIITVVYNNVRTISECIRSALDQSYKDIELIIIDGGSTDGTQKKIEAFQDEIAYYISEKDSGIFDAYNKGILKATGDIIGILNSDDFLYDSCTIQKIVEAFDRSEADLVYGNGMFVNPYKTNSIERIYSSRLFRKRFLNFGWIPLHPTIYVKRDLYEKYGLYSTNYSIASDYDISLRWFKNDKVKKYFLNDYIVTMRMGGKSTTAKLQKRKSTEDLRIIRKHRLNGVFTLVFKIGRKVPQYIFPLLLRPEIHVRKKIKSVRNRSYLSDLGIFKNIYRIENHL